MGSIQPEDAQEDELTERLLADDASPASSKQQSWLQSNSIRIVTAVSLLLVFGLVTLFWPVHKTEVVRPFGAPSFHPLRKCDSVLQGYQCQPEISHHWGQYSPYFAVPSEIPDLLPPECKITFAQILSRHGARNPTAGKTTAYHLMIIQLQANVEAYNGDYAFLADYEYALGADMLTAFGEQEMINSGNKYYTRYRHLAAEAVPFIRSSSQKRVLDSAQKFAEGFHEAKLVDNGTNLSDRFPYDMVVISESAGFNNTLSNGLCSAFKHGAASRIGRMAQQEWESVFVPSTRARLNTDLAGANLTSANTIAMMDLCPFETAASIDGSISPFCDLFSQEEWQQYGYYQSLGKYYGFGNGNPFGATNGVGFANELIARMTGQPVNDHTSTNRTLDLDENTFPLGPEHALFADFSHDNDLTGIFSALGLYNATLPLSNTSRENANKTGGYTASWTVPFGARAYFEKMTCRGEEEELVRVLVNDRVLPLETCGGDDLGRCKLSAFINSLSFAADGGHWEECFT